MLLNVDRVVPVGQVPVGKFFYMKPQNGEGRLAYMANQVALRDGDYSGPVVVTFPIDGRSGPRPASNFTLAVAAVLTHVRVVVDTDDLGNSSTETLGVPAGLLLLAGESQLITLAWGELDAVTSVNFGTGEYRISDQAGTWLSFKRWQLHDADGTVLFTGRTVDPAQS